MASIINAATSGGLISTGDTSGQLQLQTAGTTALTVSTAQNVGIGTSSPTTLVDLVRSSTSGSDVSMPNLFVRNTSATQGNGSSTFNQAVISVSAGNSTVFGGIRAAYDSAGSYGTGVQLYANSTNPLQFYANGSERARFDSSGNLLVGTTSAVSGGGVLQVSNGITFPATQSASSNANTLDDYEEGSWTLTITPGSGSFTVANNTGYYVKIGKVVYINMWWRRTGESGLGGGLTLGGFPFPFESNSTDTARQRLWVTGYAFSSLTNRSFMIVVPDGGGSATTGILATGGTDYSGGQNINASNMTGVNTEVYINGFYMTNT